MWRRDILRLTESLARIKVSPLGAAALAGTTFPIDPQFTADQLGFPEVFRNSLDAVSDRDFLLEFLAHASIIMVHLSRLSEELILWSVGGIRLCGAAGRLRHRLLHHAPEEKPGCAGAHPGQNAAGWPGTSWVC